MGGEGLPAGTDVDVPEEALVHPGTADEPGPPAHGALDADAVLLEPESPGCKSGTDAFVAGLVGENPHRGTG